MNGEVIGINTAILSETNAYAGIGFALPSKTVVDVYNQLTGPEHKVSRGSIGIMFDQVENPAIARVYGSGSGVTISSVVAGSPADQSGLKVGDTITTVDGKKVGKGSEIWSTTSPRASLEPRFSWASFAMARPRKPRSRRQIAPSSSPRGWVKTRTAEDDNSPKQSKFGVTVRKVTPEMADRLDMEAGKGVIVQDVKPGSFAEDVNVARGDIILQINKQPVNSEDEFTKHRVQPEERAGRGLPGSPARFVPSGWHDLPGRYTSVTQIRPTGLALTLKIEDDDRDRRACAGFVGFFVFKLDVARSKVGRKRGGGFDIVRSMGKS